MTSTGIPAQTEAPAAHRRYVRNLLLNRSFQIKFTSYVMVVTIFASLVVGSLLFTTTKKLYTEAEEAVAARSKAAEKSKELGNAVLANELVGKMHDPTFSEQLKARSEEIDREYEREKQAIIAAKAQLVRQQRLSLWGLVGGLATFILLIGLAGIWTTHRIVGPLYRMNRISMEVAQGRIPPPPHGFRSNDELKDTVEIFTHMLQKLREQREQQLQQLSQAKALAKAQPGNEELSAQLQALENELRESLN